jgi:hypothetical protein
VRDSPPISMGQVPGGIAFHRRVLVDPLKYSDGAALAVFCELGLGRRGSDSGAFWDIFHGSKE